MTPRTLTTPQPAHVHTILERSVCLTLTRHYLGNDRKVDLRNVITAATGTEAPATLNVESDQFRTTMKLLDTKELRACTNVLNRAASMLKARAISAHKIFGERTYLIPVDAVEAIDLSLQALQCELELEADALAERYQDAVERQARAVGVMFNRRQYLTPDLVRAAWSLEWDFVSFAAPDKLETVSAVLAEKARAKYESRLSDAYNEVVTMLRGEALSVIEELEQRLSPGVDGLPKTLRGTALRDLQQFCAYLPSRNLTGDTAIGDALANVARLAEGLSVQSLRDSDSLRDSLRSATASARETLSALVNDAERSITFAAVIGG